MRLSHPTPDAAVMCYVDHVEIRELANSVPTVRMDFDGDTDVDQADYGHLQACYSGPGIAQNATNCLNARLDGDDDVDLDDFGAFQGCFSGPGISADLACDD